MEISESSKTMDYNLHKIFSTFCLILLFSLSTTSSYARYQEPVPVYEDHLSIGPSVTFTSSTFDGQSGYNSILPTFSFRWGRFFGYNNHDEPLVGFELFQHKRIMFGIAATSGRTFLDLDDITADRKFLYYGITEDRERAYEAGFMFRYFSRVGLVEIKAFRDASNTYGGPRASISWSRPFPDTGNWTITPRAFVKHYGAKFNNYYFGVSQAESDAGQLEAQNRGLRPADYYNTRPLYTNRTSGHIGCDLFVEYNFSDSLKAVGYLMVEKFSGQIETSPLVEQKQVFVGNIGLEYKF